MFSAPPHHRRYDDWDDEEDEPDDDDEDWDDEDDEPDDDEEDEPDDEEDDWDDEDQPPRKAGRLQRDLARLSEHFDLWIDDDYRFVIVRGVRLPPGYNYDETDLLLEIPADYPITPPGIGEDRVYVSPDLRCFGRTLTDLHPWQTPKYQVPGFGPWAWLCYQAIGWSFLTDDLVKFVEMVRADLTSPST